MILKSVIAITVAYLFGAVNFAIILTRLVTGNDIRTMGNRNPGASNMGRSVGRFWGILVLILDSLKGIIPILIARLTLFKGGSDGDFAVLYLMGIAAVLGHIFPVYYSFKGGGGVSTMLAVSLWFVPLEFLISMLGGGLIALIFLRRRGLWLTQWSPIMFITLTPFVTLAFHLTVDIPVWQNISLGGHPWTVVAGAFVLSLMMLGLNLRLVVAKMTDRPWEKHETV